MIDIRQSIFVKRQAISLLDVEPYKYPHGLNLSPDSELHSSLLNEILSRVQESADVVSRRLPSWAEIDRVMTAYIDIDEEEAKVKEADRRKPVSIMIPVSYAVLKILMTYMSAALLQDPLFRYSGVGPEDIPKAAIMEHLMSYQAGRMKMFLPLYYSLMAAFKYGYGPVAVDWVSSGFDVLKTDPSGLSDLRYVSPSAYEGNRLTSIDPRRFYPDMNIPTDRPQDMEFISWIRRTTVSSLLREEAENPELYFNTRYIKEIDARSGILQTSDVDSGRDERTEISLTDFVSAYNSAADVIDIYAEVIPADWGLGSSKLPEKWVFQVVGDTVIRAARPTNLLHRMYPVAVFAPDTDGHIVTPVSRMELIYGLNEGYNFEWNSHAVGKRKLINNMVVIDPGIANYNDMLNTKQGAVIRLRRAVWGLGKIDEAVKQLDVRDVTQNNINDMAMLFEMMKQVAGVLDPISGSIPRRGERVSATEARLAGGGSLSRLRADAELLYAQAMRDLSDICAWHVVQLMENDMFVKVSGRYSEDLYKTYGLQGGRVKAKPEIFEDFAWNVISATGDLPDTTNDPQSLTQFLQLIATSNNPQVAGAFDTVRILKSVARKLGIRDIEDFVARTPVQATVVSDQGALEGASNGNLAGVNENELF